MTDCGADIMTRLREHVLSLCTVPDVTAKDIDDILAELRYCHLARPLPYVIPRPSAAPRVSTVTAQCTSPGVFVAASYVGWLPSETMVVIYNYNGLGTLVRTPAGVIVCAGVVRTRAELDELTLAAWESGDPPPDITYRAST